MQVWDYRENGGNSARATCCAPADFDDARSVAELAGFPFYVFNFEDSFRKAVIDPFVESYLRGVTPNPCIECNRRVKFHELRERAASLGARFVATGHYAQIFQKPDGSFGLFTARDERKDQSYFLYALTQQNLASTLFPIGALTKDSVRELLAARGLAVASKRESQDICFVSSSVGEFVAKEQQRRGTTAVDAHGEIISANGERLGEHDGVHRFTVGQRRGLRVSGSSRLYVLRIDAENQLVEVGEKSELEKREFVVDEVNWVSGKAPTDTITARVKMRYRHSGVLCQIEPLESNRAKLSFLDEWSTVSPGQAAVFYDPLADDSGPIEVLGGGTILQEGC
jgi:tRNA-specific 2-thiouridylase